MRRIQECVSQSGSEDDGEVCGLDLVKLICRRARGT